MTTEEEQQTKKAYCTKCKTKRPMINPETSISKNNRIIYKSKCKVCGRTICLLNGVANKNKKENLTD